ncbi:NADH:flavin oxidoreductase/NADH oxidase [Coriobacterium glomerans PW2]|uniref:NADH:flavin oxidoreductase/NADH oxidase n=1 Tax=Coriobacterium glomerans (strain ATCC 49209 / DSM 20642 / JCM 10262 / PW2) TaxID=700015 RepID=F2N7N4_CORGP|nr:FAD-dependent oxidoreductase [Coriobacterium glomerans]AEB06926.1 NADH:flavin oxidoreductase/NADH oxidase [Coriobacterium glomerans PW2]
MDHSILFSSARIGSVQIKNRYVMAPMGPLGLSDAGGGWSQRGIDYYVARAKGGTGLITTGVTFSDTDVETHGVGNVPLSTFNPPQFIRTSREMCERVHAYDAKIFLQMSAGFGRVTIPGTVGDAQAVAPSAIPHRWLDTTCRPLRISEVRRIVESFGQGARNAQKAGFDGVEIHAVHEGYLLDQFAISMFNRRSDEYGGSLENRLRFAREILEEIKSRCGADFPVSLRFSLKSMIKDWRDGALPEETFEERGRDTEEGIQAARLLESFGYDALSCDVGTYDSWWWNHPPMYQKKGLYRAFCKVVKQAVSVPVICAGRMDDPDVAAAALSEGDCDMIGLGRPLLADPEIVNKIRSKRFDQVRPCLSCQEGCMGRIQHFAALSCAVNPQAGRESDMALTPLVGAPKHVMIIGGGVAGCEAARVLALRGHTPELFERTERLGGNLIPGGVPDFKEDDHALAAWYVTMLAQLGVPVHLGSEITSEIASRGDFDAVIVATGSVPKVFSLGDDERTFTAAQVLLGERDAGRRAAVIGGGLVGCELALWLAMNGTHVTIVEAMSRILALNGPLCSANRDMLERLVPYNGISVITSAQAKSYADGILTVETSDGAQKLPCDSVILSVGYRENNALYEKLASSAPEIYLLGDARHVSNIMYAIWDAFEIANHI